jgi:predicted nuclease of predicted toxin-antitoxin system
VVLFFADECVASLIVNDLRSRGHDVASASDLCPGDADDRVLALAAAAGRVLITDDWGFGELAIRQGQAALGVVILSVYELPAGVRERYATERIIEIIDRIEGHLAIVEPGRIRFRPLPGREDK